jgi:hemerythrin-like metal-binding protein
MALMNWTAHFATGIEIVDQQHQHLVKLINESAPILALSYQKNAVNASQLLDALTEYAVHHFQTEDELMQAAGIDSRHHKHHKDTHGEFANTVISMRQLYENGDRVTGSELLGFLANWLIFHILGEDQDMAKQIKAINDGATPAEAYQSIQHDSIDPKQNALTQALIDLYALMTEQNRHLLEANLELQENREHLEEIVTKRTQDLETARYAAETANRARSAFIANLSHEIRTPMNAIVGLTRSLHDEITEPGQKNKLERIDSSTQQLLGIINDLIDISRLESEQLSLEPLDFDLRQIIEHINLAQSEKARQKGLLFTASLPEKIPALLHGDPIRITQIINNFVSNAIKFTQEGSVQLRIELLPSEQADLLNLLCEVEDSGIGIPPEQANQIFQPFEQLDQSTRRRFSGTGLGLAICQQLAHMMGGDIKVSSQPGQGSTFSFSIPLSTVGEHYLPTATSENKSQEKMTPLKIDWQTVRMTLFGLTHLLADDDVQSITLWRTHADLLKAAFGEQAVLLENELNLFNFETALKLAESCLQELPGKLNH